MSYFTQPVITNKAIIEVANAIQNNQSLSFTRLALGTGNAEGDFKELTGLVAYKLDLNVVVSSEADTFKVTARLNNNEIDEEIHVTELGLFAKVGTAPEFLYLYTSAEQGDLIPANTQNAYVRTYFLETTISNDGMLKVDYITGSDTFATLEDLADHVPEIATQDEAEAGTDNSKMMTSERTKQSINAFESSKKVEFTGRIFFQLQVTATLIIELLREEDTFVRLKISFKDQRFTFPAIPNPSGEYYQNLHTDFASFLRSLHPDKNIFLVLGLYCSGPSTLDPSTFGPIWANGIVSPSTVSASSLYFSVPIAKIPTTSNKFYSF